MRMEMLLKMNKQTIDLDVNVNKEGLSDMVKELEELTGINPNIIIRNNDNVYITINNCR